MTRFKREREIEKIKPKEYSRVEIQNTISEMNKFRVDGKWKVESLLKWYQSRRAIKIYNLETGSFGVILPTYTEVLELQDRVFGYERKQEWIEKEKVEGLEELAEGMQTK